MKIKTFKEHECVTSRTTGKKQEVSFGPLPGGLVPRNPFASKAQSAYLHANPEKLGGDKNLKEWEHETDYSKIPKKVKK